MYIMFYLSSVHLLNINKMFSFSARALRWMQTMTFAIREINQRSDLLPALRLGFHIRDSCDDVPVSLKASLILVNGQPGPPAIRNGNLSVRELSGKGDLISLGFRSTVLGCADVTRSPSPVIIGDASSGVSMALLRSLGPFQIPLVRLYVLCSFTHICHITHHIYHINCILC